LGRSCNRARNWPVISKRAMPRRMSDAAQLLQATLDEEKTTDKNLTALAKSVMNVEAEREAA